MGLMHLMGAMLLLRALGLSSAEEQEEADFTVINGQIYTPGLAIIDAPQPFTPEGGDNLQVAIDVSGDGTLPLTPYDPNIETGLLKITLFLTSYTTGLNLTISNGTTVGWLDNSTEPPEFGCNSSSSAGFQNAGCQEVMLQESGSTVKHVDWVWPDCLVGDGGANDDNCGNGRGPVQNCLEGNTRGPYNISIHQSFRVNGTLYYTIIDLPIDVTNSISNTTLHSSSKARPFCTLRNNPLLSPAQINSSTTPLPFRPFLDGSVSVSGSGSGSGSGVGTTTSTFSTPTSTRLSTTEAASSPSSAASLPSSAARSRGGFSATNLVVVLGCVSGALAMGLLALVFVLCYRRRRRSRNGPPRLLSPDDKAIENWRGHKDLRRSRNGLRLNPPDGSE